MAEKTAGSDALERDIALGDRRGALDGLIKSIGWLVGTALLLNGGALVAVVGKEGADPDTLAKLGHMFLSGLFAAIIAATLGGHYAVQALDFANVRLARESNPNPKRLKFRFLVVTTLFTVSLMTSFGFFGFAAIEGLEPPVMSSAPPAKSLSKQSRVANEREDSNGTAPKGASH